MAKGVLGNDPFQRGAAARPPKGPDAPAAAERPARSRGKKSASEPKSVDAAAPTPKAGAETSPRKKSGRKKTPPSSPPAEAPLASPPASAPLRDPRRDEEVAARIRSSRPQSQPELEAPAEARFHDAPRASGFRRAAAAPAILDRALTSATFFRTLFSHAFSSESVHRAKQLAATAMGAITQSIGALSNPILDPYGKDPQLLSRLEPVIRFLYEDYWRVEALDALNVPDGPALLVANHSGAIPFDGPVLQRALQKERPDLQEPRWLVEDQIFDAPIVGTVFNRLGAVRASPDNATRLLEERRPVLVFPEGIHGMGKPFAERYQLKRFGRGGFVKLALKTGAPIVPVAIIGAEEAAPLVGRLPPGIFGLDYVPITPLGPIPLPSKWIIRFGDPIRPEGSPDGATIERYTQQTRGQISAMLEDLLRRRKTVFTG